MDEKTEIMYYVYCYANKINSKKYIGKTNNIKNRQASHISKSNNIDDGRNSVFHKAIRKYGIHNFSFNILFSSNYEKEIYYIELYKTNISKYIEGAGYNLTDGGEGTSGYKISEEERKSMSERFSGANNPFYGKKVQGEHLNKISGENSIHSKINKQNAIDIIYQFSNKLKSLQELAEQYNLGKPTIFKIVNGLRWKGLERDFDLIKEARVFFNKKAQDNKCILNTGENNPYSIFTNKQIIEIKKLINEGKTNIDIGKIYNVSHKNISYIRRNRSWKNIG